MRLRDHLSGAEGDEIARKRVETFANKIRPPAFVVSSQRIHSGRGILISFAGPY